MNTAHQDSLAMREVLKHDFEGLTQSQIMGICIDATRNNLIHENGCLDSEVRAARSLSRNLNKLPKDGTLNGKQAQWEELGFEFFDDADDIYRHADFPDGWGVEHRQGDSRHMSIVDENGNERGNIFAKHTFYDRYANCGLRVRISIANASHILPEYKDRDDIEAVVITFRHEAAKYPDYAVITQAGIFTAPVDPTLEGMEKWDDESAANKSVRAEAEAWLAEHYPDWRSPAAYWDVEIPGGIIKGE